MMFGSVLASLSLLAVTAVQPPEPIVIDGSFDDWRDVPIAMFDPADAPGAEIDFGAVRLADDEQYLHLLVELGAMPNIQRLDGRALILLDGDGDPATGKTIHNLPGVDVIIELTPAHRENPERAGMGIGLRSVTYEPPDPEDESNPPLLPYDVGFTFAPTYAHWQVEMRLERGAVLPDTPEFLTGRRVTGKLVLVDLDGHVLDGTEVFTHQMRAAAASGTPTYAPQPNDPLARSTHASLRVASWNGRFGALIKQSDAALRELRAIEPDVLLIQEFAEEHTAEELRDLLQQIDVGEQWHVMVGEGGGPLRSALATRLPITTMPALEPIPYPDWEGRFLRTCGAVVEHDGYRLLVMSVHLKCCGRIGDDSDVKRLKESSAIHEAILLARQQTGIEGVVVAGDFNLVGSRTPLEVLRSGLDIDGSNLRVLDPLQLDRRTNATWEDANEPFVPGRLDYMLTSDASLQVVRTFVLDTRDLQPQWLKAHGLNWSDGLEATDHLPLVADLRWISGLPGTVRRPSDPREDKQHAAR